MNIVTSPTTPYKLNKLQITSNWVTLKKMRKILFFILVFTSLLLPKSEVLAAEGQENQTCRKAFYCPDPKTQRLDARVNKCLPQTCQGTDCQPQVAPLSRIDSATSCNLGFYPSSADMDTCTCTKKRVEIPITQPDSNYTATCSADNTSCTKGSGIQCNTSNGTRVDTGGDGIMTAIGCIPTQPQKLVEGLLRYGTFAAGGVAFVLMLLASIQMITAEGNPNTIKSSQEKFYSAIIGLLLIIFSVLLMQVIGVDLLGLKGFTR